MYLLALLEAHLHHLAIYAALHCNGVKRFDRAKPVQIDGQIAPLRRGYSDRHTRVEIAIAVASTATRGRGGLRFVGTAPNEKASSQNGEQKKDPDGTGRRPLLARLVIGIVRMELHRARGRCCSFLVHDPLKWLTSIYCDLDPNQVSTSNRTLFCGSKQSAHFHPGQRPSPQCSRQCVSFR